MKYVNMCHFDVVAGGERYPAPSPHPFVFEPILAEGSHPVHPVLLGFRPPVLPDAREGTRVIVPRFAAAVGCALELGLEPYCVPLSSGRNAEDNSYSCDELEPAPEGLSFPFLKDAAEAAPIPRDPVYARMVGGPFMVQVTGGPDLPPILTNDSAHRRVDGTIFVPWIPGIVTAILVPQDGKIIEAVSLEYPDVALLVTDVVSPGKRTRLLQVR